MTAPEVRQLEPADVAVTTDAEEPWLYSPERVSKLLSISREQVFKLMRSGALTYVRIGRFYRVSRADLQAFIEESKTVREPAAAIRLRAPRVLRTS